EFIDETVNQTGVDLTYLWDFGDGYSREDTAEHVYENRSGKIRNYSVKLDITSNQGCFSSYTLDSFIAVLPQPTAAFESTPDLNGVKTTEPLVQFKDNSTQANWLRWDFGDGTTTNEKNPAHQYTREGEYTVTLVAKNFLQCADTISKVAIVKHANTPFIPSGFTPNGDGTNDVFFMEGIQDMVNIKMEIFDRWGNLVFSGEGKDVVWDGTNSQNRIVQQGVYAYRISYADELGEEFVHQGNVTVLGVSRK
ncbi:MAG: gliding motility-associated C-terminal domain-containing protein, partial [Salibacteraceae bacterium]